MSAGAVRSDAVATEATSATTRPWVSAAAVVIDVADLRRSAEFWSGLFQSPVLRFESSFVDVVRLGDQGPVLSLQHADGPKVSKNRVHLDLAVDDFEAATERVLRLGASAASPVYEPGTNPWQVFADPEGNEFCLVTAP